MEQKLVSKVAIVTGAGHGIGAAAAICRGIQTMVVDGGQYTLG